MDNRPFDVVATLAPVRRRMGLARVERWSIAGLGVGATAGVLILLLAHILTAPWALPLSLGAVVLGALAGAAIGIRRWPDALQAARAVDRHFGLQDRLTTALEYRSSAASFPALQRADVPHHIQGLALEQSGRGWASWQQTLLSSGAITLLVLLLFVGGTARQQGGKVSGSDTNRIRRVTAVHMPQVQRTLEQKLTPQERNDPALRKLQQTLARLQQHLLHIQSRRAALRAISATQQQLRQLAASLHPVNRTAVAQLNRSLARYMTAKQRADAAAGDRKALTAASQLLQALANHLSHLSAAQRAQRARALARAANGTSDPQLRSALQQAASSLAYNDPQSAARSLQQASTALARTTAAQAAQAEARTAGSQLDNLKNEISGLNQPASQGNQPGKAAGGQGQGGTDAQAINQRQRLEQGQAQGQNQIGRHGEQSGNGSSNRTGNNQGGSGSNGTGRGTSAAAGQGQGQRTGQGLGAGQTSARTPGQGQGSGGGKGGTGSRGAGGGRGGAGPNGQAKGYATVYIPGKQGKGPTTTQTGPQGAPLRSPLIPYQQVIGQYSRTAHEALDRANLPPSLRTYVRDYFATVSH